MRLYTFADFCELVREHEKADLIDGVIYMASPENTGSNRLLRWLATLLNLLTARTGIGEIFFSRVAFRLDDSNGPEPDIGFVLMSRLHLVERGKVRGRPDAAMEIVSPESIERDYQKKRRQFERARVPEYWIIDEIKETVVLLRLGPNGKYRQVRPVKGKLHSDVMKGFWLRPEWLFTLPRPYEPDILNEILASR
jgi:Uma2 family endonuclease